MHSQSIARSHYKWGKGASLNFTNLSFLRKALFLLYSYCTFTVSFLIPAKREFHVFGGAPIIKFGRWSKILNGINKPSVSIVPSIYDINTKKDFDYIWQDFMPKSLQKYQLSKFVSPMIAWFWIVRNAKTVCSPVGGISFFDWNGLGKLELIVLKSKKIKIITISGGGDSYMLADISDGSTRHALQASYPERARMQNQVTKSVRLWEENSDIFIASQMLLDGFARNDLVIPHMGAVDNYYFEQEIRETQYLNNQNLTKLKILHAPNHREFKGTEFLESAVKNLIKKGVNVELLICERKPHSELVKLILQADLIVDQLIMPGYSNFAIEAMALGKPVIANIKDSEYSTLMMRYSFLSECPILHAVPENIENVVFDIYMNGKLKEIGDNSRNYAYKYHSEAAWVNVWSFFEMLDFDGNAVIKNSRKLIFS